MAIQDRVIALRDAAIANGNDPVPDSFQGVTKAHIRHVLSVIDREFPDIIDAVFALLDDVNDSWFSRTAPGTKFCAGATIAHVGSHIGILQRGGNMKLDREGRDFWIKPLRELGAINFVYLNAATKEFISGHPIPKSPNCAYRLADDFKAILQAGESDWSDMLQEWVGEEKIRQRAELQASLAQQSLALVDTKHRDLIIASAEEYAPRFLPGYQVLYKDIGDGDRVTQEDTDLLSTAGISIGLGDAMPDVLLWNPETDALWVIEAVTSDGEVDEHKVTQLKALAERHSKSEIGFTTTYLTWKDAAARQHRHKNIAPDTYIWILEDPSKHLLAKAFN